MSQSGTDISILNINHLLELGKYFPTIHKHNSYEITINGFHVRKINEIRNVIFSLRYERPFSVLRPKLGCSVSAQIQKFWGKPCFNDEDL